MTTYELQQRAEYERKVQAATAWLHKLYSHKKSNNEGAELILRAVAKHG